MSPRLPPPQATRDPPWSQARFEEICRRLAPDALRVLIGVMGDPKASPVAKASAARTVIENGFGRTSARQPSDLDAGLDGRRQIGSGMSGMLAAIEAELAQREAAASVGEKAEPAAEPQPSQPPPREQWKPLLVPPPAKLEGPSK